MIEAVSPGTSSQPTIGLALGGGSARGLAHIPMLEVFDELGVKPSVIAGTSIGSIMGALYASGMSAAEIRAFAEERLARRSEIFRRLAGSIEGLPSLWNMRTPTVIDGVTLFEMLLPPQVRTSFEELKIPFHAVTTDFHAMDQVVISHGPVIPAIAASSALPTLLRPVAREGRVLIDGGFVNPTPFDVLRPLCDRVIAIDVSGATAARRGADLPGPVEAWIGSTQIMFHAIVRAKAAASPPDLFIRPEVGGFGTLDFHKIKEIFAAATPARDALKRGLERMLHHT